MIVFNICVYSVCRLRYVLIMFVSSETMFLISCFLYTLSCGVQDRCASRRLPTGKSKVGKRLLAHKKPLGKTGGYGFQCPLVELRVLPSSLLAVYLHMTMMFMSHNYIMLDLGFQLFLVRANCAPMGVSIL